MPAFLENEAWVRARLKAARVDAAKGLEEARAEAQRVRTEGEAALTEAVLEGERQALRAVEAKARDRISEARRSVAAWLDAEEDALAHVVELARRLLTGAEDA